MPIPLVVAGARVAYQGGRFAYEHRRKIKRGAEVVHKVHQKRKRGRADRRDDPPPRYESVVGDETPPDDASSEDEAPRRKRSKREAPPPAGKDHKKLYIGGAIVLAVVRGQVHARLTAQLVALLTWKWTEISGLLPGWYHEHFGRMRRVRRRLEPARRVLRFRPDRLGE